MVWETPPLDVVISAISSPSNPIGMRMRAAYFLRQIYDTTIRNTDENDDDDVDNSNKIISQIISTLGKNLENRDHGSLMRHELAYVMGQIRDDKSVPTLERTLSTPTDCIIVRHECAEALAAINSTSSLPLLQQFASSPPSSSTPLELIQTCQIAVDFLNWKRSGGDPLTQPPTCACLLPPYSSIDPAPPHPSHATLPLSSIGDVLRDESLSLFERYRAMFSLRNRGGDAAADELGRALVEDRSSALFRHEVAYVLGQMQESSSLEYLEDVLRRTGGREHAMVRHEAAEAIGALEGRWEECEVVLREFEGEGEEDVVVRESCMVALDGRDYWSGEGESFGKVKAQKGVGDDHFNVVTVCD